MKDEDPRRHRSQRRRLAAPALLLVPPPRSAALDLGGDGGETVAWRACGVATVPGVSPGPIIVALSFEEYSSAMDASDLLKPALARGQLRCIGATTVDKYRKDIEKDKALGRRFHQVYIGEPSQEEAVSILWGIKSRYEVHHGVRIRDEALLAASKLSSRYLPDRSLPDKAIDLVDEACTKFMNELMSKPMALAEVDRRIVQLEMEKLSLSGDAGRALDGKSAKANRAWLAHLDAKLADSSRAGLRPGAGRRAQVRDAAGPGG